MMNPLSLLSTPLEEIDRVYSHFLSQNKPTDYNIDLSQEFSSCLFTEQLLSKIVEFSTLSSYSDLKNHNGKLVQFTYMVQNIDDPEIYAHCLLQKEKPSNFLNTKFRENFSQDFSNFDLDNDCVLSERLSIYCIPITGENYQRSNKKDQSIQIEPQEKIAFKDVEIDVNENIEKYFGKLQQKGIFNSQNSKSFPAIVKVYDSNMQSIKLNEVYQFVGILNYSSISEELPESNENFDSINMQYPMNLVPRIHCLSLRKITENQIEESVLSEMSKNNQFNLPEIQKEFIALLNHITNDELCSFYILFGILNTQPQKKSDILEAFRKLVVNVYKSSKIQFSLPNSQVVTFAELLSNIFERICLKSLYFPLEIECLEKSFYIPTKNYENNRLEKGNLQMTSSTVLFVDETKMKEGKLTERGIKNLQSLNDLLENQTLSFDFSYHQVKVSCECNVLVFSEGKSFLKTNLNIPLELQCANQIQSLDPKISKILESNISAETQLFLDSLRFFILKAQQNFRNIKINEDVSKKIEEDYVQSRKATTTIDVESLQRWIIVAKLFAAMEGCLELPFEAYLKAKDMESLRLKRII